MANGAILALATPLPRASRLRVPLDTSASLDREFSASLVIFALEEPSPPLPLMVQLVICVLREAGALLDNSLLKLTVLSARTTPTMELKRLEIANPAPPVLRALMLELSGLSRLAARLDIFALEQPKLPVRLVNTAPPVLLR